MDVQSTWCYGAHGVVVSHPLRMRKALGSNPSVSIFLDEVTKEMREAERIDVT